MGLSIYTAIKESRDEIGPGLLSLLLEQVILMYGWDTVIKEYPFSCHRLMGYLIESAHEKTLMTKSLFNFLCEQIKRTENPVLTNRDRYLRVNCTILHRGAPYFVYEMEHTKMKTKNKLAKIRML